MDNVGSGSSRNGNRGSCLNCDNIFSAPLEIDLFAKKPELRLPSGSTRYTSLIGCMCTLVYMAAVVLFGFFTLRDIVDMNNVTVETKVDKDYWDAKEVFPYDTYNTAEREVYFTNTEATKDIHIAFGVAQAGWPLSKLKAEIGTVKAYIKVWDYETDTHPTPYEPVFTPIEDFDCTPTMLGLDPVESEESSEPSEDGDAPPAEEESSEPAEPSEGGDASPAEEESSEPAEPSEDSNAPQADEELLTLIEGRDERAWSL